MNDHKSLPKTIEEWRKLHPHPLNEQTTHPWQEIVASLKKICDDIIDGDSK